MTSAERSKGAVRQSAYLARKRAGMKAVTPAWQGLSSARIQEAAKTAYRAVTWHHRASGLADAQLLCDDLVKAFADLLERMAGRSEAADWVDAWLAQVPAMWTAQYPVFVAPQAGEEA